MGHYIVVKSTPNPNPNYRPPMGCADKEQKAKKKKVLRRLKVVLDYFELV